MQSILGEKKVVGDYQRYIVTLSPSIRQHKAQAENTGAAETCLNHMQNQ